MMNKIMFSTLAIVLCFRTAFADAGAPPVETSWQPAHTWLFVVGALRWKHAEMFGSFPQKERRDAELVEFFKGAGVPPSQIVYLRDRQATQARIDTAFAAELKEVQEGDLLFVYYAGHGYKSDNGADTYLASYDAGDDEVAGWSVNAIPDTIQQFPAVTRVLWVIDRCYSGQAAAIITRGKYRAAYACAASSSASESSTGHWTFTEALLDALRGAAYVDLNHDGKVTLAEFAQHAERDMTLGEEQESSFATAGDFDRALVLATAKPLADPRIGERVKVKADGQWWTARVIAAQGSRLTTHFIGYGNEEDVTVEAAEVRPIQPTQYAVGMKVDVLWKRQWYPATVLQVKEGTHYIHYDDYAKEWDEWVSSKRIRARKDS